MNQDETERRLTPDSVNVDQTTTADNTDQNTDASANDTKNNANDKNKSMLTYLQSTLTYYFKCLTSELDAKLATGNHHFNFDTSKLFTADTTVMYKMYENAIKNGLLTPNEARAKLGLPAVDGGDRLQGLEQTPADETSLDGASEN